MYAQFQSQRDLIVYNSIYPEFQAVVENTDDPTLFVGIVRAVFLGTIFVLSRTSIEQFFSLLPSNAGYQSTIIHGTDITHALRCISGEVLSTRNFEYSLEILLFWPLQPQGACLDCTYGRCLFR